MTNPIVYDSREDTLQHSMLVRKYISAIIEELNKRKDVHDISKLLLPEKEAFDTVVPKLKNLIYGSEEYHAATKELGEALKHHYACNSHHPEHWIDGVLAMDLVDIIEMLCDWMAAGERHEPKTGIHKSMDINKKARFKLGEQLAQVLLNTALSIEEKEREKLKCKDM